MWTIIGHKAAVSLLERGLEKGTISHAYLLVGPAHVGKMKLAVKLAQAVNCESPERPCGQCAACLKIAEGKHADIQVIELEQPAENESAGKTKISVEQIEQILHSVNLPPFEGKHKVFIIDGFENLSIAAANRLLKTLEEPVSQVVFILLTTRENLVPQTIVSRCQRIELAPLPYNEIEEALLTRWHVEPLKARLLARLSAGCLGWAVNMVEDDSLLQQRNDWLDEWLEVLPSDYDKRFVFAAKLVEKFNQNRDVLQQKLDLWLNWWRDVLLVKTGNPETITNVDREETLTQIAGEYNLDEIRAFITRIKTASRQLRMNANPQLVMEVLMLNFPENGKVSSPVR
ncbi:MAG: AAA family ATPase [Dehalococcoidales bacterium]|nr:AAA family ATPase [Dehalococcoidales bacterium]